MGKLEMVINSFCFSLVAVDKSRSRAFDVIILDLDMPIMSGYEACRKIKQ